MRLGPLPLLLSLFLLLLLQQAISTTAAAASSCSRSSRSRLCTALITPLAPIMAPSTSSSTIAPTVRLTRRHALSALAGPLSASSSVAVANSGSISTVVRRSSPRLLSSFNTDDDANDKAPAAAKDEEATSAAAVKEEEPPRKKTRGRPRKNPAAAAADVKGKRPTRASAAAAVTTLSVTASSFKEESSSTSTSSRPRRRRTSKDSEASDGSQESDITAVAMKMEVEAELEAVSLPPSWERRLQEGEKGITFVYGVDEAGRGPLAGPVVAAACHIPSDLVVPGIQDSKALDEEGREAAYAAIVAAEPHGVRWAVQIVDHARIDEINILQATFEAMRGALGACLEKHGPLDAAASYALVDGNSIPANLPTPLAGADCVIKGDSKVRCIAAASILAKVTRDRIMMAYHADYPEYGFAKHKGYPTPAHKAAILQRGPCAIHRMTFRPIKK